VGTLHTRTLTQLAEGLRRKSFSSVELVSEMLARIRGRAHHLWLAHAR